MELTIVNIMFAVVALALIISLYAAIVPVYGVWAQRLQGRADLAQAEAETQIAVLRAQREEDAAKHYAEAEVIRAKGVSRAIDEVKDALGGPEGYLRWQYVNMLEQQDSVQSVIYVPTEAGLPILEAGHRRGPATPNASRAVG